MVTYHIFDVDGTITPSRKPMEEDFVDKFYNFCKDNKVILVSGSDLNMIAEQIPPHIFDIVKVYGCAGVEGSSLAINDQITDSRLLNRLEDLLNTSVYEKKTGNHIAQRKGMINFSIVGRNATDEDRTEYMKFDSFFSERENLVKLLKKEFPEYEICIGGEISIDITKVGVNKSLVAKDILTFDKNPYIIFYGNGILDGNDYALAKYIKDHDLGHSIQIEYKHLKNIL